MPQKCLTLPTLLETGFYDNLRGDRPIPRARAAIKVTIGVTTSVMIPKGINVIAAVMKATPARIAQSSGHPTAQDAIKNEETDYQSDCSALYSALEKGKLKSP